MKEYLYKKELLKIFKYNFRAIKTFTKQIYNYYDAKKNCVLPNKKYKIGEYVKLDAHQLMRGEGAKLELNEDKLDYISQNGFISPDLTINYVKNQKTPLTIPVWNIQKSILLKDYIKLYSGATLKYSGNSGTETKLIPYGEIDSEINENMRKYDFWSWQCEQTKEIRFMPSLARDEVQVAFIMNLSNEYGKKLLKNDIFDLSFDKRVLKSFVPKWFIQKYIYGKRDDFTTNRESAIIFGIPACFIEGILVGKIYEKDSKKLKNIKKYFPNCYICNLEGKVIVE